MSDSRPVLFGEVLFDCFQEDGSRVLGGAPFNVAWHLHGLGLEPLFISRVGDDLAGEEILTTMRQRGMDVSGVQVDPSQPTGEVSISLQDGQPTFDILAERAYDYIDAAAYPSLQPALLYHGSLAVRNRASAAALDSLIKHHDPGVFLDVNLRSPWWESGQVLALLDHANWLKVNDDELDTLLPGPASVQEKARELQERHNLTLVIVTRGAAGAECISRDSKPCVVRPNKATHVVDTVGAGDAFAAIFILGIMHNWPQALILERAQYFASLIVANRGAIPENPDIYRQLREQWQV